MTLYGECGMNEGKEIVKRSMKNFDEQCYEGKEEHLALGTLAGGEIRTLGTWIGGKQDMQQRTKKRKVCSHDHQEEIEKHHGGMGGEPS